MYNLFVQFHKEKYVSFLKKQINDFSKINEENNIITILIHIDNERQNVAKYLGRILSENFNASFNPIDGSFYINNENVFDYEKDECIYNGHLFWIERNTAYEEEWAWIVLDSPEEMPDTKIEYQETGFSINVKVNGNHLLPLARYSHLKNNIIGRKVFWLDPCALDNREHTSDWKIVTSVKYDIVTFDDDTEAYISECYA